MKRDRLITILASVLFVSMGLNAILASFAWDPIKKKFQDLGWIKAKEEEKKLMRNPPLVRVAKVEKVPMGRKIEVHGTVQGKDSVQLVSSTQGLVRGIYFKPGVLVKKGAVLVQLDDQIQRAEVLEAKAHLDQAVAAYRRSKMLWQRKVKPPAEFEKDYANMKVTAARLEHTKAALSLMQIKAPFDGYVGLADVSVGAHVSPQQPIATIYSADALEVNFAVRESEERFLAKGQELDVFIEGVESIPFTAKVSSIEPFADPITHQVRVRAMLVDPEKKVKPGAFARVLASLSAGREVMAVPVSAILKRGDTDYVYIVDEQNVARRVPVVAGAQEGERIQITDGLQEGLTVVSDGVDGLADGMPVRVK